MMEARLEENRLKAGLEEARLKAGLEENSLIMEQIRIEQEFERRKTLR